MKKAFLLLLSGMLVFASCQLPLFPDNTSKEAKLTGTVVDVGTLSGFSKLFVLNEGQMGTNNASLDMLRLSDCNYITGVFKKMNPKETAGLGDVGNDIVTIGDELWIAVNNSGIVDILSAKDETEIAAVQVPMPRCLAFDANYVYVTSWNGAVTVYGPDWSVDQEKSKNPKGAVYRIDRYTKKLDGSVEVGYQPEGIALYDGKLYVANSGGISSSQPPLYSYDKTVSVVDLATFKVTKTIEVEINPQKVYADGKGNIYVSSFGNYTTVHSCLWHIKPDGSAAKVSDLASFTAALGDTVYCMGNANEFDYNAIPSWRSWKCKDGVKINWGVGALPGFCVNGFAALPGGYFIVADAGNYFEPGTVTLYHDDQLKWTVMAGVCPGHFAIW
ncbi:MAG: hypothetical protein J5640_02670 [Bacteroidales bacterium]|nr:hypothetical protein [Bacteroidales bacterium]